MSSIKRERWTEADIDALPPGEHDYFDRKSGRLFAGDADKLQSALAKALSAFANSGGGHLILGVADDGTPDGIPPAFGRTSIRDWLEQKIPHLVSYALSDFRVHIVERGAPSRIPSGSVVAVIDVGDSALAPHQCAFGAPKYFYFHRQAGRSEPAPHFYLELLRQRLVNPVLEAKLIGIVPEQVRAIDDGIFVVIRLKFLVENVGRVAAYKWKLMLHEMRGLPDERGADYHFDRKEFPKKGMSGGPGGIRIDDTILPGCSIEEERPLGVFVKAVPGRTDQIYAEIDRLLVPLELSYRIATETSRGELNWVELWQVLNRQELVDFIIARTSQA